MMDKKYVLLPGFITSKNDGDRHFISARQLSKLYGVKMEDCFVCDQHINNVLHLKLFKDCIHLAPRFDGDYQIKEGG